MRAGSHGKGRGKNSDWKNSIQYGGCCSFVRFVNSAEKERKVAREDKYYSGIAIFFKYDGILCHY